MRVVYRTADKRIVSTSGISSIGDPEPGMEIDRNVVPNIGGQASDYAEITVSDIKAREMYNSPTYELAATLQGTDDDVICYQYLSATVAPNPVAVNTATTVTANLPPGSPDAQVTFQVQGGAAYTEPVANLKASHAFAFASAGTYQVAVSSAHHGTAWVGVIVQ